MAIKRGFGRTIRLISGPSGFVWRVFLHPALSVCYRLARATKKLADSLLTPLQGSFLGRYAMHAFIGLLAFLVTATNIQAMERPSSVTDLGNNSILSSVTLQETEDLLVEEFDSVAEMAVEVSYLEAQAIRPRGYFQSQGGDSSDGTFYSFDPGLVSPPTSLVNAVRVQIEFAEAVATVGTRTRNVIIEHAVDDGENIGSIARLYDLQTTTVLQANDLSARSLIRPGQKLVIPPVDGLIYTIKSGDTLNKISNTYKSDVDKILAMNGLDSAGSLSIGQRLILPDGKVPPPPPQARQVITTNLGKVFTPSPAASSSSSRLLWPTSARRITQYFKYGHAGLDIAGPIGTPIYAADDGVVVTSGWNSGGYGYMILIDHGNGIWTRYGHSSRLLVQKGDRVSRGDVISLMGSTGRSTGPHLHFEVLIGGIYNRVNPLDYIK